MSDDVRPAGTVGSTASVERVDAVLWQTAVSPARWLAALTIGVAVGFGLWLTLLLIPHLLLTRALLWSREVRVALATSWIAVATGACIWLGARYGRTMAGEA